MNITFDKDADALYIRLQPSKKSKKTKMLKDGILVDFDGNGKIYGIEILDASTRMPMSELKQVVTNLPTRTTE